MLATLAFVPVPGCAEDVILPVDTTCGDLILDEGEECDLESDGCVDCQVATGWRCDDTECEPECGDARVLGDEECDPPDGITCDSSCKTGEKPGDCDMNGYWIIRQTDFSIDNVVNQVQTSSNWYAYFIEQSGDEFAIQRGISCGIRVTGSATANLSPAGTRGLMHANSQGIDNPRGPRRGTFRKTGDQCAFTLARHYLVRGANPDLLPEDFLNAPDFDDLPPLPYEEDPQNPNGEHLEGAEDSDGDGKPGVAYILSGSTAGTRHVAQRDWNEYSTADDFPIPTGALEFTAASDYDNEENILLVEGCPLVGCGVILASSVPDQLRQHRVTWRYLGQDLTDPRVSSIIEGPLREDLDVDVTTCANVRSALPHDPSKE